MIPFDQLEAAAQQASQELLAARTAAGHWQGELSSSALSTATAISALALVRQHAPAEREELPDDQVLDELIQRGLDYLAGQQNEDGGWGDTSLSYSNIATSMLVQAARQLAGSADPESASWQAAEQYLDSQGRSAGLAQRYGQDKTFAVPILTNAALAGMAEWREVSPLPFELACFPQALYRLLKMPVVSYAIPALVAIGQARYYHRPPRNPLTWIIRRLALRRSVKVLRRMQPSSGGYLEATPLTSFVVMSLASIGRATHPVSIDGVRFLLDSIRADGSWPIDTNLATWNTSLALAALARGDQDISQLGCLEWLLSCQHRQRHAFTGASPGGWGWSDLDGAVPDCDDTPAALLALDAWRRGQNCSEPQRAEVDRAAAAGLGWLLQLQNRDGGWPTFCRGWGQLPFDRSGADLTAHVLRAFHAWGAELERLGVSRSRVESAVQRGFKYLDKQQRADGSWLPLWFGNQDMPGEENPVHGTSRVLLAYHDWDNADNQAALRGYRWLAEQINSDGGWGGGAAVVKHGQQPTVSSVEETALAIETLWTAWHLEELRPAIETGTGWLVDAVNSGRFRLSSPIGFYFAKLWYHERLYPMTFTVSALGRALATLRNQSSPAELAEQRR